MTPPVAAQRAGTSLQRTYRYLRLAIAGAVVVVFAAIVATMPRAGLLPSISHYYYTPANTMFVGALIAVAVSFFALSGRGAERVLLDVAAVVVPLIAIVPTQIAPGSVPGVEVTCRGGAASCVPESFRGAVEIGVLTYLIVGLIVLAVAVVLAVLGEVDRRGTFLSIGIASGVLLLVWLTWWWAEDAFLRIAHVAAAVVFFGLIAAVALITALAPAGRDAPPRLRTAYIGIASALALVVAAMPLYGWQHVGPVSGVFVGEVVALVLFAAFWVLQSVQYWNSDDPAILARS